MTLEMKCSPFFENAVGQGDEPGITRALKKSRGVGASHITMAPACRTSQGWARQMYNSRTPLSSHSLSFFSDICRTGATPTGIIMSTRPMICQ